MSGPDTTTWPERFADEAALEDLMITPADTLRASLARVDGDIIVLGVGGKMGPTLAGLAKRAAPISASSASPASPTRAFGTSSPPGGWRRSNAT